MFIKALQIKGFTLTRTRKSLELKLRVLMPLVSQVLVFWRLKIYLRLATVYLIRCVTDTCSAGVFVEYAFQYFVISAVVSAHMYSPDRLNQMFPCKVKGFYVRKIVLIIHHLLLLYKWYDYWHTISWLDRRITGRKFSSIRRFELETMLQYLIYWPSMNSVLGSGK